ncbi:MAG: hypothetical protein CBC34_000620 [Hyphomicrobiaceae bacterium TMED74]|nr:hypothetical protein [Filomicrobium sp.]RPG48320.1 MAG: hypothetical protein CBC34_000620 [Hyphomicrobiaceae bacterium TMED74]
MGAGHQRVVGLEAWGRQVIEDLWTDLEAETVGAESDVELSWSQAERYGFECFIADRARDFLGRSPTLAWIQSIVLSANRGSLNVWRASSWRSGYGQERGLW